MAGGFREEHVGSPTLTKRKRREKGPEGNNLRSGIHGALGGIIHFAKILRIFHSAPCLVQASSRGGLGREPHVCFFLGAFCTFD